MKNIRDYINMVESKLEIDEDLSLKDRREFNTLNKKKKDAEKSFSDLSREESERLYALKRRNKGFVAPDKKN